MKRTVGTLPSVLQVCRPVSRPSGKFDLLKQTKQTKTTLIRQMFTESMIEEIDVFCYTVISRPGTFCLSGEAGGEPHDT